MSVGSIEDVAEATKKPFWFQLYVMKDRGFIKSLIERAAAAKCSALVLTVDLQILGQRHKDIKNGLSVPPKMKLANLIDIATKPAWVWSILRAKRRNFGNIVGHVGGVADMSSLANWTASQFDPTLNWKDVDWVRKYWKGKLIVKGVLDTDDAKKAVKAGADAIVVSNHGGRQLDGAPSSISALPRIADAVGDKTELLVRRRRALGPGRDARARARRARLHDRPRLCLWRGRRRQGGRRRRHRDDQEGARYHHGAHRHQARQGHRPAGAGGLATNHQQPLHETPGRRYR